MKVVSSALVNIGFFLGEMRQYAFYRFALSYGCYVLLCEIAVVRRSRLTGEKSAVGYDMRSYHYFEHAVAEIGERGARKLLRISCYW